MEPSIRASFLRANLEALATLGPAADRVRARLPASFTRALEESTGVAWLPVSHDVVLTEAIDDEVGRGKLRAWARDGLLNAVEGPLLSPVARSARAIFGLTPHGFLRRAPLAWTLLYRGCGELAYEREDERRALIVAHDLPEAMAASSAYVEGIGGSLEAATKLAGAEGRIAVEHARGAREARFVCSW